MHHPPLHSFRLLSSGVHGLTGLVAALTALVHLAALASGRSGLALTGPHWPRAIQAIAGVLILMPAVLVVLSVFPMVNEGHRAFRSGAAAGFVLGVALVGSKLLFGGGVALPLFALLVGDLLLMAGFAVMRRRRRRQEWS